MKKKCYFNTQSLIVIIIFCVLGALLSGSVLAQRISRAGGNWSSVATWTGTAAATGTITSNNSSLIVTGVGSLFSTELAVGDPIFSNTGTYIGIISAIGSNTSLTLFENAATTFGGAYLRTDNAAVSASVPNATTTDVVIRAGHTVTLDQNADARLLSARGSFTTDGTNRVFTVNNNLLLLNGSNFNANNATLSVLGTTNINGTFQDTNATGANTFSGLVSLNLGATWTSTAVTATSGLTFRGGLNVNGAFSAGAVSFDAVAQTIGGGRLLTFANDVLLTSGSTVNNANFVSIAGVLNGASAASQWTNIGTLNYSNTTLPMVLGVFNASSNGNTVAYTNTTVTQAVRATNYYNLNILNGTNANPKTFATTGTHRVDGLLLIDNAQLTVTGAGKLETRLAQIGRDGLYVNATSSFPNNTTGFNSATNFTGKFDVMSADGGVIGTDNNTFIYSSSGTDAIFQRGGINGLYAVKTTNWAAPPTAVIIKFQLNAKTLFNDNNVATLLIGDGFTNSITREASTARLQFNLNAATNQYSITHPDGTVTTSALQIGSQEVTWVINTSGATYNYTAPNGVASTVANGLADLWIGTTQIVNDLAIQNPAMAMNDIKFVYDAGSFTNEAHGDNNPNQPSITINNLRIFTTTSPATSISGVINIYTPVSAINAAKTQLTVGSITGFSANDRVLVIQMKGATIDNATPATNANFGAVTAYNSAGFYEIADVSSVSGTLVTLKAALINNYAVGGLVQLIRVPVLSNPTVDGLLTAQAWNGATGGVLVLEATNTLTLNADIDVSALGFRGGQISGSDGSCALGDYANANANYGQKGEGIATDANDRARAKLANGGGGGNPHNSGGGGGGNFGAGALGARQWNCLGGGDTNNDCIDGQVAPNSELNGGQGGVALSYADNRVFMGGGGGSGQQNNTVGTSGANGGGIVIIIANSINANGYTIAAKGGAVFQGAGGDSGGGGGAGGCIFISCPSYTTAINVNVQGGKGGDVGFASCHGNGGGGGGGVVRLDIPQPALMTTYQGGAPSSRNADGSDCAATANAFFCASVAGAGGQVIVGLTILPVELVNFNVRKQNEQTSLLQWLTASEKDHDYFEVERSIDGTQFIALSRIKGQGNTSQSSDYEYVDNKPIRGINYYRLKIVAQDGKYTYSHIKTLYFDKHEPIEMTLFPNPAKLEDNFIQIAFNEAITTNEEIKITLFDALGKAIPTQLEKVTANQYKIIFANRSELSIGLYMVNVHTTYGTFCRKMILQ